MKITVKQFDDFRRKRGVYLRIKNADRFYKNLSEKIADLGDSVLLDEYVVSLKKGRETSRKVLVEFYEYLGADDPSGKPDSVLYEKQFYDYPFERQLEIAKFLHRERTTSEIQERFDIDGRTVRSDLQELEEGISVMGATIQIQKEKRGRKYYYRTTLHPVFLPLNLTEVYALTVYLDRVIKENDPNARIIRNISDRIKAQLSPYACEKLFPEERRDSFSAANGYVDDEVLAHRREGILMYLMKSRSKCRFLWQDREYTGRIVLSGGQYSIITEEGERLDADPGEVEFIIESLEYK